MSKATTRAKNKYNAKTYDQVGIMIPKGTKEKWKEEAKKRGLSLSTFIQEAVKYYINENKNM